MPGHIRNLIASRNVRGCSKISAISPTQTQGRQDAYSTGKAAAALAGGTYRRTWARQRSENAAGGLFQHPLSILSLR